MDNFVTLKINSVWPFSNTDTKAPTFPPRQNTLNNFALVLLPSFLYGRATRNVLCQRFTNNRCHRRYRVCAWTSFTSKHSYYLQRTFHHRLQWFYKLVTGCKLRAESCDFVTKWAESRMLNSLVKSNHVILAIYCSNGELIKIVFALL